MFYVRATTSSLKFHMIDYSLSYIYSRPAPLARANRHSQETRTWRYLMPQYFHDHHRHHQD